MMQLKMEEESIIAMVYTLEVINCRGLTIRGVVRKNLTWLKSWYEQQKDEEYLEQALLQICALFRMELANEGDMELYEEICALAGISLESLMEHCTRMGKRIKVTRQGISGLIGKWMPSRKNPMTKPEVVEDIMEKLNNHRVGQYYYCYERAGTRKNSKESEKKDIYKLVINQEECFFLDMRQFRIYVLELCE
ncbi:MAG: hypothetical protein HFI10_16330 [Lachnospiraceae bacterium]|nr:hypothetical protein [Lachnospiraceae bacterium]